MKRDSLNLLFLTVIQVSNAILPLIIFPYVLGVLGVDLYSDIVLSESIMFIIYAFVLYSFEVNGVSEIVRVVDDKKQAKELSFVFSKILTLRLLILALFLAIILIAGIFIEVGFFMLLLAWMLYPLSYVLQSSYFFLAIGDNFLLSIFVLLSRILAIVCIFSLIDRLDFGFLVPLIIGLTFMLGGFCSFFYAIVKYNLKLQLVSKTDLLKSLNEGKEIFFGNISVLMLKDLNLLILGLFTNNAVSISTYSIAEKILKSFQAAMRPLNSFVFPICVRKLIGINSPNKKSFLIITKLTLPQFAVLGVFSILFFIMSFGFGDKIMILRDIDNLDLVLNLCGIMIFATFFGVSNYMYGTVGLNHLGGEKYYARSIFLVGIISVGISFVLIKFFFEKGAAISFVFGEVLLLYFILKVYQKK